MSVLMSLPHLLVVPSPFSRNDLAPRSFRCATGVKRLVINLVCAGGSS